MENIKTPALILDRDGVVNIDKHYLYKKEEFEFSDGIFELCSQFESYGFKIIIITNQSGIGRGYFSENDFLNLTTWMVEQFKIKNVTIEKVYFCPHQPSEECECRKPNTKLVNKAKVELGLDLHNSVLIGDNKSDIELATRAGIGLAIGVGDHFKEKLGNANTQYTDNIRSTIVLVKQFLSKKYRDKKYLK